MAAKVNVALVGLGFGRSFLPIYREHPAVGKVGVCDSDPQRLSEIARAYGADDTFASLDEVLADDSYDAVHLLTPVPDHARGALAVLEAGRHCACAVPMATSLNDIDAILAAQQSSGTNYMMMETSVYGREFLYVKQLCDSGELGPLTFLRGAHLQDLIGFPTYWWGFPPMHYVTHALSPLLALADARAQKVHCFGSGRLPPELIRDYDNNFGLETAIFRLDKDDLAAEVTMSFFQTARQYQESFAVYGQRLGFEFEQLAGEQPVLFEMLNVPAGGRGRPGRPTRLELPDRTDLLPAQIARFTRQATFRGPRGPIEVDAHHGGSHPHLVHEFLSSVIESRPPAVDPLIAARWTAPGICAHQSAQRGGEAVSIPVF
ncbi:Gfo/Idh/MocA family oxidoreductase [Fodinicola feengrottensis]|uniref:Gfo/Idh/MocA family oxidoreductase n=1 Tax=Fodinicola feengrottensis TaxID=435914 RepID=A0ABN2I388_9ACTN